MLAALLLALALAPAAAPPPQAPLVHVDPALGVDAPGGGGVDAPYETLTYAVANHAPPVEFRLAAGTYTQAAETFPIDLYPGTVVRGPAGAGAWFEVLNPIANRPVLWARSGGSAGSVEVHGVRVTIAVGGAANPIVGLRATAEGPADGPFRALFSDVRVTGATITRAIDLSADGGDLDATVDGSLATAFNHAVRARAGQGGLLRLQLRRCRLAASVTTVRAQLFGPGTTLLGVLERTLVRGGASVGNSGGLLTNAPAGTSAHWEIRGCVFNRLGQFGNCSNPGSLGALRDDVDSTGGTATYAIRRSIFVGNDTYTGACLDPAGTPVACGACLGCPFQLCSGGKGDLPTYRPRDYVLEHNLFEQPDLFLPPGSIGGANLAVTPLTAALWLAPGVPGLAAADYHLAPGSPAIDAFGAGPWTGPDFEGDAPSADCADGAPDAGLDEFLPRAVHVLPWLKVGESAGLRVLGPPGVAYVVATGLPVDPLPCVGRPALLAPSWLAAGVLDGDGVGSKPIDVPDEPALAGVVVALQAAYAVPGPDRTLSPPRIAVVAHGD